MTGRLVANVLYEAHVTKYLKNLILLWKNYAYVICLYSLAVGRRAFLAIGSNSSVYILS